MAASVMRDVPGPTPFRRRLLSGARRRGRDDSGAELIEFALLLPILLVITVGIFDFGVLFQKYLVVTNAAREGARLATLPNYTTADIQERVATYISAGGVQGVATTTVTTVSIQPAAGPSFSAVQVRVVLPHTFAWLGPVSTLVNGTFSSIDLTAVVEMRKEGM